MNTPAHSKIISKVAREVLKPIGVKRKGQSRTWLDDNGWWITVVEFQPSGWSKGTYLNVAINWQWYPNDHFSFDVSYREPGFVEYETDEQFELEVRNLAEVAKIKVQEFRSSLVNPKSLKDSVIKMSNQQKSTTLWPDFHRGMACAISGSVPEALAFFKRVVEDPHDTEWAIRLKAFTNNMIAIITSGEDYIEHIHEVVNSARSLKKLEHKNINLRLSA